jgi:hypothetical protein
MVAVLAVIAAIAPTPIESNRDFYQTIGYKLSPGCGGGDCFRPLIPGVLENLPGPSLLKWKAYAVVANAIGAIAVGRFCLMLGVSAPAALSAMWLSALGAGSLYSLFDAYSSDALMYMLGPLMAVWFWRGRYLVATAAGLVGIFAKEFAAAPIWIFSLMALLDRRWNAAVRLFLCAAAVTLAWLALHTSFMTLEDYGYGATASADLLHGGFLATWLKSVGLRGALVYLFTSLSALYLLCPVGLAYGPRQLRLLAVAALPALAAFFYVQQPERALWSFHFIIVPLAAVALQTLTPRMMALFVASFAVVNLRYGAQLQIRGAARGALLLSLAIAAFAVVRAARERRALTAGNRAAEINTRLPLARTISVAAGLGVVLAVVSATLLDVQAHRRDDDVFGANLWGYRGQLWSGRHPGVIVAMVGGSAAFAARTPWPNTMSAQLSTAINAQQDWTKRPGPYATIVNLADPGAGAGTYVRTLRAYTYLRPDIIYIYDGYDDVAATGVLGRDRSIAFRLTGYLPRSPASFWNRSGAVPPAEPGPAPAPLLLERPSSPAVDPSCGAASAAYCAAMVDAVRAGLEQGRDVVVATPPYLSPRHQDQQRSLAARLALEFARESRFHYVDLGNAIDLHDTAQSEDGVHPTLAGDRIIATRLAEAMYEPIRARVQ